MTSVNSQSDVIVKAARELERGGPRLALNIIRNSARAGKPGSPRVRSRIVSLQSSAATKLRYSSDPSRTLAELHENIAKL